MHLPSEQLPGPPMGPFDSQGLFDGLWPAHRGYGKKFQDDVFLRQRGLLAANTQHQRNKDQKGKQAGFLRDRTGEWYRKMHPFHSDWFNKAKQQITVHSLSHELNMKQKWNKQWKNPTKSTNTDLAQRLLTTPEGQSSGWCTRGFTYSGLNISMFWSPRKSIY